MRTQHVHAIDNSPEVKTHHVGLKIVDLDYVNIKGLPEVITAVVWYPTAEPPSDFVYHLSRDYQSKVAFNASVLASEGPYPLVIYVHGGFSSGYASAYFTEFLAKYGYIVVAPDFIDTKPPDYTEPIAFSSIKRGKEARAIIVLRTAKQWVADMNADRNFFLAYLAEHRLHHLSFVIDSMLSLNKDIDSVFHHTIQEEAIGVIGWSEGGVTVIGKIGGHEDKQVKDDRIKAALIFSAPASPFEKTLDQIKIPLMLMVGDNDKPALGSELPRRLIYDKVCSPKYYLVLKNANHFAFGNQACGQLPLYEAVKSVPEIRSICRYGLAFFQRHLRLELTADEQLSQMDSEWAYYVKEESPGKTQEWGTEPDPRKARPMGGIGQPENQKRGKRRGIFLRRWLERSRN
jgi:predicted dienelactone hydrolase